LNETVDAGVQTKRRGSSDDEGRFEEATARRTTSLSSAVDCVDAKEISALLRSCAFCMYMCAEVFVYCTNFACAVVECVW